ncbi:MAG: hypothetical protein M0R33_04405 [Methylomonas sp.]|uniref:hypothetical protein n=1 Tax=Methylomonas sp. TaxID=418 RepID=UPI0025F2C831|nr:hypothetical protein [Methylomonas sp.]MCK9605677.1 hypothetical protein [Methylomonas sp.]
MNWTSVLFRNKLCAFLKSPEQHMDTCYPSMPKFIGAFFDALYQHPVMMLVFMAGITALAGSWWYKSSKRPESR